MLAIIDDLDDSENPKYFTYGTSRFEYVWEAMIDKAYGIREKEQYFPSTMWNIKSRSYANSELFPDSIMIWNNNVYVLDAKYYKYGATRIASDLPQSSSINKQITYGEFIAEQEQFAKLHGKDYAVYNAFLMPFCSSDQEDVLLNIGEATSNWKSNSKTYERVQGILIDVKYLMKCYSHRKETEIGKLVEKIEEAFQM